MRCPEQTGVWCFSQELLPVRGGEGRSDKQSVRVLSTGDPSQCKLSVLQQEFSRRRTEQRRGGSVAPRAGQPWFGPGLCPLRAAALGAGARRGHGGLLGLAQGIPRAERGLCPAGASSGLARQPRAGAEEGRSWEAAMAS